MRKIFALTLLLGMSFSSAGCVGIGRSSAFIYSRAGENFPENPATIGPYFFGLATGAIAAAPLVLLSWPLTKLFFPDDGPEELRFASILAPSFVLGSTVAIVISLPLAPFGVPFMSSEDDDGWDDDGLGDNFAAGPPGGDADPTPPPWRPQALPGKDGALEPPLRGQSVNPWESYDRPLEGRKKPH